MPSFLILSFIACYAVALGLAIARLSFRREIPPSLLMVFAGLGFVLHAGYLAYAIVDFYQYRVPYSSPLSSKRDWYLVAAWVVAMIYLYLAHYHPRASLGLFLLPLILALSGIGSLLADPSPFPREPASKVWGVIHGTSILLASVAVLIGFAAGLMYLRQSRRLKRKVPDAHTGVRLPSLEWLQRTNGRAVTIALITTALSILSGIVLNLTNRDRADGFVPWYDPVVLSTLLMFGWLLVSSLIGWVYRPAREGRKVAYLTVVSLVFLIVALAVVLFNDTQHGGVSSPKASAEVERVSPSLPPEGDAP